MRSRARAPVRGPLEFWAEIYDLFNHNRHS